MSQAGLEQLVNAWLNGLDEEHRRVIQRRFGLDNQDAASCDELARELGLGVDRVRRMQVEALEQLVAGLRKQETMDAGPTPGPENQ